MTRIIGPPKSRRRRWTFLWSLCVVLGVGMFFISGAQAVHELGVFELDTGTHTLGGNPYDGANATDEAAAGNDWDNVCYQKATTSLANGGYGLSAADAQTNCGVNSGTTNATAVAWTADSFTGGSPFIANGNATIFTGGGSKDPQDTTAWAWKDGSGGLPDKDNLQHAFAARYTAAATATFSGTGDTTSGSATVTNVSTTATLSPGVGVSGTGIPIDTSIASINGTTITLTKAATATATGVSLTFTFCPSGETSCDVIYFGSDRLDNSGDAQQGFWFLQNPTGVAYDSNGDGTPDTPCPQKVGGGTGFCNPTSPTGAAVGHANGDLLVISDFSNGGTTSTITIYQWQSGALSFLAGSDVSPAECGSDGNADPFCGIVNLTDGTPSPWGGIVAGSNPAVNGYTDKSGNHSYLKGELFEAGVDLTNLGLAGECFSSVVSETRASTSPTATLKDFVVGSFAQCSATLSTTPKVVGTGPPETTATSVAPGTAVHDVATITGNQPAHTPSGTVTFRLCSFAVGSTDTCDQSDSNTGLGGHMGAAAGTCTLSGSGATASCASPSVNTAASPLVAGHYCFYASWPGDVNYVGAKQFDGAGECFDVTVISTSVTTHQFYYPNDSATVTAASGTLPDGNVTFRLYGPTGGATPQTALQNCTTNGGTLATGMLYQTVQPVTSASPTVSTNNTSVKVPTDATNLYWRVTYVISPPNPSFTGSSSTCVENNVYTHNANAADTATFNNDPNLP